MPAFIGPILTIGIKGVIAALIAICINGLIYLPFFLKADKLAFEEEQAIETEIMTEKSPRQSKDRGGAATMSLPEGFYGVALLLPINMRGFDQGAEDYPRWISLPAAAKNSLVNLL